MTAGPPFNPPPAVIPSAAEACPERGEVESNGDLASMPCFSFWFLGFGFRVGLDLASNPLPFVPHSAFYFLRCLFPLRVIMIRALTRKKILDEESAKNWLKVF